MSTSIVSTLGSSVTLPGCNVPIPFGKNKSGAGLVILSQKDLGAHLGLKGAALKRAHFNYRMEAGKKLNVGLNGKMTAGEIICKGVVPTKSGDLVAKFTVVANMTAPAAAKKAEVVKENEELKAKLARLEALMAAQAK